MSNNNIPESFSGAKIQKIERKKAMKLRREHIETMFPNASQVFVGSVRSKNFQKMGEVKVLEVHEEEGGYKEIRQWRFPTNKEFKGIIAVKKRGKDIIAELYS